MAKISIIDRLKNEAPDNADRIDNMLLNEKQEDLSLILSKMASEAFGKNVRISPDTCRKYSRDKLGRQTDQSKNSAGKAKLKRSEVSESYIKDVETLQFELDRKKIEISDIRNSYKQALRDNTRHDVNIEILTNAVKEMSNKYFLNVQNRITYDSGKDIIACLSDLHIGQDVKTTFGEYNSDIAKARLEEYTQDIINIASLNDAENIYVAILGDLISGNIHLTTKLENRENAIEQTMIAAELVSSFIYELSKYFKNVYVVSVSGNHSRIGFKDEVLRTERLDDIIPWFVKKSCEDLGNVKFYDNKETTIGYFNVRGNDYLACHGDFDAFSEKGMNKLINMVGFKPTGIFFGHLHHCSFDELNNVKLLRSGSFCGSYDDYSISKRLTGKASQMVCVATEDGIESMYVVDLEKNKTR